MKQVLIDALEKQYEAEIAEADVKIKLLFESSVAVSEHLNHQQELDNLLHIVASAEEKLSVLEEYTVPSKEKDAV